MMTSTESITTSERPGIAFAGTCDLAIWCKLLHDKGWSGPRIARAIAKSEGYVNNLIRVVERASPSVLLRWRAEQNGLVDHVCATDWLIAVCLSSHERQDEELQRRIAARAGLHAEAERLPGEPPDAAPGAPDLAPDGG
jgi:hypothetical protein